MRNMKAVKIVLVIITLLFVGFFLTGLIVPEVKYTTTVKINKPISSVFEDFENIELMKQWMPEIKSIDVINETPNKIGSKYKMVVENQGQLITMTEEILAYEPNKKIDFYFDAENILKKDFYTFQEEGNSTIIKQQSICTSESYIMSCLFPYFKSVLKNTSQKYLNQFKEASENLKN